jgi:signal transduction histidine kinase
VAEVGAALVSSEEQPLIELMAQDVTGVRQWQNYAQSLVAHITTVQEEERKWVAQEIHDETIQTLLAVSHQLDDLKNSIKGSMPGQVIEHLDGVRALTLQAINDLRRLCQGLRPAILDDMGLIRALTWLADSAAQEAGITVHIMVKGTHRRLPPHVELGLFRIAQEAIRNIKRHSRASEATVIVKFGRADIRMSIKDNGIGFKVPKSMAELVFQGKLGLLGMKERARLINGVLRIYSSEAQGTRASVKVPY